VGRARLTGATVHHVTADLGEGPVIEQDVVRVTHEQTAVGLVAIGRDVERLVLSRAVRRHADNRVILVGARTVVFEEGTSPWRGPDAVSVWSCHSRRRSSTLTPWLLQTTSGDCRCPG
jgi:hypothetical protein